MTTRPMPMERDLAARESTTREQAEADSQHQPAGVDSAAPVVAVLLGSEPRRLDQIVPPTFDARAQATKLQDAFAPDRSKVIESDRPQEQSAAQQNGAPKRHRWIWRLIKTAVGLAVVAVVGWVPVQHFLELSSTEAVMNARLVTLRAPIDGEVVAAGDTPEIGLRMEPGSPLLRVVNRRADRGRLDDLRRAISQFEGERPALNSRLNQLEAMREQLAEQLRSFQAGRIRELEARVLEVTSSIAAAKAVRIEATTNAQRMSTLVESGTLSKAAWDKINRDLVVATETEKSLQHRMTAIEVELEAARRGSFVGDSYNDRPSSMQQMDVISMQIAETRGDLRTRDDRLKRLQEEQRIETARYSEISEAILASPVKGSVWEVLIAPGEEIRRGQDLVRLLDCSGVVVTTNVSEAVFNRLKVGDAATFRFFRESVDYVGTVIRLSGLAAPPDNLAI